MLLAVAVAAALAITEVTLRCCWHNDFRGEQADRVLVLTAQHQGRGARIQRSRIAPQDPVVEFRTDKDGFILPSRRFSSPDYTILFQGGSTTECIAVAEAKRWPYLVSVELERSGMRANCLNSGRSGATAHDALVNLLQFGIKARPQVAVLMNVMNDYGLLRNSGYGVRTAKVQGAWVGLRWLTQSLSSRSYVLALLRRAMTFSTPEPAKAGENQVAGEASVAVDTSPYEARLRAWVGMCRAFGIVPVLMTEPYAAAVKNELTPRWAESSSSALFNEVVRRVARDEKVVLVDLVSDLAKAMAAEGKGPAAVFYDGCHVHDQGSEMYGRLVAQTMRREVLSRLPAGGASSAGKQK